MGRNGLAVLGLCGSTDSSGLYENSSGGTKGSGSPRPHSSGFKMIFGRRRGRNDVGIMAGKPMPGRKTSFSDYGLWKFFGNVKKKSSRESQRQSRATEEWTLRRLKPSNHRPKLGKNIPAEGQRLVRSAKVFMLNSPSCQQLN